MWIQPSRCCQLWMGVRPSKAGVQVVSVPMIALTLKVRVAEKDDFLKNFSVKLVFAQFAPDVEILA